MMLPEGWRKTKVAEIFDVRLGKMLNKAAKVGADQRPYLTNINVRWGHFEIANLNHMNFNKAERDKFRLKHGDLIVCEGGEVGRSAIWKNEIEECYYQKALHRLRPINGAVTPDYMYSYMEFANIVGLLSDYTTRTSIAHLTREKLLTLPVNLPPLSEQRRIAEILSTWDRAIETVEALIANARAQKKALMQSLLTGKHRLPGFSGEWETTALKNVAQVIVSNVDKKSGEGEQPVRLCNYMDVYRADRIEADMPFMRATAAAAQISKFGLRVGDVLITKDSETPDDIAVPSYVASTAPDLVCGYHLAIIRAKPKTDGQFLKYYFEQPTTQHFFASRANGATRFGLTIGAIESAPITLPSLAEQQRIGEVIAVAELENHRLLPIAQNLRQEKSALMQQLLTGKRRVKVDLESDV